MAVSTGVPNSRGQWTKKYSDGAELYYSTFVQYKTGQGGRGLNPTLDNTYLLYERDRGGVTEWVTAAKLSVDGKLIPLKESEAFRVTGENYNQLERIGGTNNKTILGDLAIKDLNAAGTGSLRYQTINNAKYLLSKDSGVSSEEVNKAYDISNNIKPPGSPGTPALFGSPVAADQATQTPASGTTNPIDPKQVKEFDKQRANIQQRTEYESVVYPEGLRSDQQDCIKFSIIKYQQSGLKNFGEQNQSLRRIDANSLKENKREILATIVLPIPGGINDNNQVVWSGTTLNDIQQAFGKLAQTGIMGGDMLKSAQASAAAAAAPGSGVGESIVAKLTQSAISAERLMQRQFGVMINPNLELLLDSPYLRQFAFSFKLSPRSKEEAIKVKQVIRNFKQAMSVKRSASSFLLQTPHTFAISYVFKNRDHPYLNRFKECALTSCSVNYTPEGNYMSFDDPNHPSMVSYQVDLQFQELEPVFDDDYGNGYENIGY